MIKSSKKTTEKPNIEQDHTNKNNLTPKNQNNKIKSLNRSKNVESMDIEIKVMIANLQTVYIYIYI